MFDVLLRAMLTILRNLILSIRFLRFFQIICEMKIRKIDQMPVEAEEMVIRFKNLQYDDPGGS